MFVDLRRRAVSPPARPVVYETRTPCPTLSLTHHLNLLLWLSYGVDHGLTMD